MQGSVVLWKYTDVSEVRTTFIMREIIALMEAVRLSETSGYLHKTTWRYIPESCNLYTRRGENLKSHNTTNIFEILNAKISRLNIAVECSALLFHIREVQD
jgi:hypothetical protein